MRDLARQNYSGSTSNTKIAIPQSVVRILLILTAVLLLLFIVKKLTGSGGVIGSSQISLRDAPKGLIPVAVQGSESLLENAVNLTNETATFTNVGGESATATASRKYGDGSYSLTVNATLPDPKGNTYQVWIVGGGEPILAGKMNGSGRNWSITFNDKDNYSDLNGIWITREITNFDEKPELHILEGTF